MDDVAIIRLLGRRTAIRRLPATLLTSGRRYLREGIVRTWLRHTALITLYYAGVSPHHLARREPSRECGSRARSFTCSFSMIPTQRRRLRMKQR